MRFTAITALIAIPVMFGLQQNGVKRLSPGQSVERKISGSEPHVYEIFLPAGKFLQIRVTNHSIPIPKNPLRFRLRSSSGELLSAADEMSTISGRGRISWVGEENATFQLEVIRDEQRYWSRDPEVSYSLLVLELRDATPADSHIVAAEKAIRQDKYDDAVEHYRIAGDQAGLAESLEMRGGLESYQEALQIERALGNPTFESADLLGIAFSYRARGDYQNGLNYANQGLTVAQESKDAVQEAKALNELGSIYQELGDSLSTLDVFRRSYELSTNGALPQLTVNALNGVAAAYEQLGDRQEATAYRRRIVDFVHSSGNRNIEALYRNVLSKDYIASGQYALAMDQLTRAMELYRGDNHGAGQMRTLIGMGNLYLAMHDPAKARDAFAAAMEIETGYTAPDGPEHAGPMRIGMGEVFLQIGNKPGALDYFNKALEVCRQLHDWRGEVEALRRIAEVESSLNLFQDARSHLDSAMETIESVRGHVAGPEFRSSYSASKRTFYETYLDVLMHDHADASALESSERFRMRSFAEMLSEARIDIREGIDHALIEKEQSLAQRINRQQLMLLSVSNDKSRLAAANGIERELNDLILKYEQTEADIRANSPAYSALTHPRSITVGEIQRLLDANTLLLEYWLGEKFSYLWLVSNDAVTAYTLPERAVIEKEAEQFYSDLTAPQTRTGEKPEARQARVAEAGRSLRASGSVLSRTLLGPVLGKLGTKRLLIVADGALYYVPFATLPVRTPCATAHCLLLNDHEIVSVPSASVLRALRDRKNSQPAGQKMVAVFADPVFDKNDSRVTRKTEPAAKPAGTRYLEQVLSDTGFRGPLPRLRASRQEAQAIVAADSSGRSTTSLDFAASRDRVLSGELTDYRLVHFATHGFIDNTHPELSGLVLSLVDKNGADQDGLLRLNDIYNLKLPTDLVVLSACNTALGKRVNGEGLIGLTRGFMYAGAPRVISTLWKVDDEAAAMEMDKMYRNILVRGMSAAAALRAAQLEILKSPSHQNPYYWAAFTLQGER